MLSQGYSIKEEDQQLAAFIRAGSTAERDRTKLVLVDEWYKFYQRRVFTTARTRAAFVTCTTSS
jgi:hypothetical protein